MSVIYAVSLIGVAIALIAALFEGLSAIRWAGDWGEGMVVVGATGPKLQVIETEERRTQSLPFVGADRREVEAVAADAHGHADATGHSGRAAPAVARVA